MGLRSESDLERHRLAQKAYRERSPEKTREIQKRAYRNNAEKRKAASKKDYSENRDERLAREKARARKPEVRYRVAKSRAKARGLTFTLTYQEYIELIKEPCKYCWDVNTPVSGVGLDRMDSSIGYEAGNVVSCCQDCNLTKREVFSYEEMLYIGQMIHIVKRARSNPGLDITPQQWAEERREIKTLRG